jgi:hypothetical protein
VDFLPLHTLFVLITSILSHFKFYNLSCINFDGKCLLRKRLVFNPYTLHTLFQINVWVDKCLDAILWGKEINFIKC